jgi:(1->4)-alpha-D-glucan 1-alpha-D-glucosylmutase
MTPRATYRLQFNKSFPFDQAASLAAYLAELGISHVYASPYLQARPDSKHGYDITDHNALNAELGGGQGFERMLASFREHGLEHILDYVPNHMGVGGSDNPIWLDVLEWGRESRYFGWFDIDWHSHAESLSEKLLVPFLGDQYGKELESGKIELKFDPQAGEFSVWLYGTHKLPVAPATYAEIVGQRTLALERLADEFAALPEVRSELHRRAAELKTQLVNLVSKDPASRKGIEEELKAFRGQPGQLATWKKLDHLIRQQHWRPTHFRVAADDINYRRFFNISDLAGIRMELPEVFELTHRLVIRLIREGKLQGLRIDHIDGLFNPKEYLQRLRAAVGSPFYLVVEKILANHEGLRQDWPVEGTTGYDFCAEVTALLVDPAAEQAFTDLYLGFTGEAESFHSIVRRSKIKIMENEMGSELESLAREAVRIAQQNARTIDFTQNILLRALKEIIACFPVYRTYVDGNGRAETDERYIHWAVSQAINNEKEVDASAFEFLESLLTARLAEESGSGFSRHAVLRFAMRAQQFSGPVMAKGLEDTALYRYNRFIALNDVGSMPDQFGLSVHTFHKENQHRAEKWPHTMLGTSTHDVKRGEDARARLAALSLIPDEWAAKVDNWNRILRARRGDVEGNAPPSRNDQYLFFQNLVGTWPAELTPPRPLDAKELAGYCERLCAAMTKSLREARVRSNWTSPNTAYEEALSEFIRPARPAQLAGPDFSEGHVPRRSRLLPRQRALVPQSSRSRQSSCHRFSRAPRILISAERKTERRSSVLPEGTAQKLARRWSQAGAHANPAAQSPRKRRTLRIHHVHSDRPR